MPTCSINEQMQAVLRDIQGLGKEDLDIWAKRVAQDAKRNITANRTRIAYRANWVDGRPKNVKTKKNKGKIDSTGRLRKSVRYEVDDNLTVIFYTEYYGQFVDRGRQGIMKRYDGAVKGKKGIPEKELRKWIKAKPIRPRNLESGGFVKKTPEAIDNMVFLMNRKIRYFGIAPTKFLTKAVENGLNNLP